MEVVTLIHVPMWFDPLNISLLHKQLPNSCPVGAIALLNLEIAFWQPWRARSKKCHKIRYPSNLVLYHSYFIKFSVFSTWSSLRGQDGPVDQVRGGGHDGAGDALKTCPWAYLYLLIIKQTNTGIMLIFLLDSAIFQKFLWPSTVCWNELFVLVHKIWLFHTAVKEASMKC